MINVHLFYFDSKSIQNTLLVNVGVRNSVGNGLYAFYTSYIGLVVYSCTSRC